jgi:hypothetical protein
MSTRDCKNHCWKDITLHWSLEKICKHMSLDVMYPNKRNIQ